MKTLRQIYESLVIAVQSVVVNKLRTLLSLLGITIGIFAIISVFTVLDSLERSVRDSVSALGNDIVFIDKWPWQFGGEDYQWWKYANRPVSKQSEFYELPQLVPDIEFAAIQLTINNRRVKYDKEYIENIAIIGATYDYKEVRRTDIASGRYFTPTEFGSSSNLAIIGDQVAVELFKGEDPIGKTIIISGKKLEVIGVFVKEGSSMAGLSWDQQILVPYEFVKSITNMRWASPTIALKPREGVDFAEFKEEVASAMRRLRRIPPTGEDNFSINEMSMANDAIDSIFLMINLAGGIIGMFSILVGGFGIANIMFVSVRERTGQIGIQKALGAKPYMILLQFVFEAVMLSVIGGIIGLLLIFVGTQIVNQVTDFTIVLTFKNIMIGLGISSVVGAISGIFPAYAAATMEPVKAIYKLQ